MEVNQLYKRASELFYYEDGKLLFKEGPYRVKGKEAGWVKPDTGYRAVSIDRKQYKTHRIIFLLIHGYLPEVVDHIDRNKLNNKIENLREATYSKNALNSTRSDKAQLASFSKEKKKWKAQVRRNNKCIYIGYFESKEKAQQASIQYLERKFGD